MDPKHLVSEPDLYFVNEAVAARVLARTDASVDPIAIARCVDGLKAVYAVSDVERNRSSKNFRTLSNEQLPVLLSSIEDILDRVAGDKYEELRHALTAASFDLYFKENRKGAVTSSARVDLAAGPSSPENQPLREINELFETIETSLNSFAIVINHLKLRQSELDRLSAEEQLQIFLGRSHDYASQAYRSLYPYLRKRQYVGAQVHVVETIAAVYSALFKEAFLPRSITRRKNYKKGEPRFEGRCISFACAVIEELRLHDLFVDKANRADRLEERSFIPESTLINTIGDAWANHKRRKVKAPNKKKGATRG